MRRTPGTLRARRKRGEEGQAVVLAALLLPLFFAVIGLAIDGGTVFAARRELQNTADAAARAGATQIDVRAYRQSSGETVALDPGLARQAAAAYLATRSGITGTVAADTQTVVVEVSQEIPLGFMRLMGLELARVSAAAPAEVRAGVERGG